MRERLNIAGFEFEYLPPGSSVKIEPVWAEERAFVLGGREILTYAGAASHYLYTLSPGANYVVPLSFKVGLEALHMARAGFALVETYSNPAATRTYGGVRFNKFPEFAEVPGTLRQFFTYSLILEVPA